jgi:hypothetical protein
MRVVAGAVYGTVAFVVLATFLSGPLVGFVDFTHERDVTAGLGEGNLTVRNVSLPATATVEQGFQTQNYYVKVADAQVQIASISGRPMLEYELSIDDLQQSYSSTHFLDAESTGTLSLALEKSTIAPDEVSGTQYNGTLVIVARYNGTEQVLRERSITVEVRE